jgi:hypothetical protein
MLPPFLSSLSKTLLGTLAVLLYLNSSLSYAQEKQEQEFRIDDSEVPQAASSFIAQVPVKKSFRWYKEKNGALVTFEAKGRWNRHEISIEFDDAGVIEDIEITQKMRSIPQAVRERITAVLKEESSRYRIKKMQYQFVGKPEVLLALLMRDSLEQLSSNYELVVQVKVDNAYHIYEYLFDNSGKLTQRLEVMERNSFNIQF